MKTKGKSEADRLLQQSERRILGLAYIENVEALLLRIKMDLAKKWDSNIESVYVLIDSKKYDFKDKWIPEVYEILYDWERNIIDGREATRRIHRIIL